MKPILLALGATASVLLPATFGMQTADERPEVRPRPATPLPEVERDPMMVTGVAPKRVIPASAMDSADSTTRQETQQDAMAAAARSFDRHAVVHHDFVNSTHWARGKSYKASAAADGFTYIPYLGSDAPRNFPVRFELTSVERSGATFQITPTAEVSRDGARLTLDRGDVEVRYDLDVESVEQSFAFVTPAGSGDVTMEIAVTSELQASMDSGALHFQNEFGGVNYGEAIVLDGAGRQAAVASRWTGNSIELTVPAAFVDSAVGPIVVDPVLTTTTLDSFSDNLRNPDLAYDAVSDRYLVVYEEQFSTTDFDIYSIFVSALGLTVTDAAYVELGADSWVRPKVAQQRNTRKFLVVAQADSIVVSGSTDIAARFRLADGTQEAPFVLKGATSGYACVSPDIGSEFFDISASYYCVVYNRDWTTDNDVVAIMVDVDGNYVGTEIGLGTFISRDEGIPSVSKTTGTPSGATNYVAAWPTTDLNSGEEWIQSVQIAYDGSNTLGPINITTPTTAVDYFDVEISSMCETLHPVTAEQYYVVTYDDGPSIISDAFVALCSGMNVHSTTQLQITEHATMNFNDDDVVIGTLAEYFLFGYVSGGNMHVTVAQPIVDELGLTERRIPVAGATPSLATLTVATTYSGGAPFTDGLFVWSQFDGADLDIMGVTGFASTSLQAAGSQYCYGVENATGDRGYMIALGNRNRFTAHTLAASALPLNTFGYFLSATGTGNVPTAGGSLGTLCLGGSIGRFGTFNSGSGGRGLFTLNPQAIPQPMGPESALAGQTWNFQSWHRDSSGGTATSNFTNAVAIPFL